MLASGSISRYLKLESPFFQCSLIKLLRYKKNVRAPCLKNTKTYKIDILGDYSCYKKSALNAEFL